MTTATTAIRYDSIDDCLGPGANRFFSEGYKRVAHAGTDVVVTHRDDGLGAVRAKGALTYPADWSRKSTKVDLRPHLSSIDALLFGVQLAETYLTHTHRLDEGQRRRMWLRRFVMRAGSAPQEELADFDLQAQCTETRAVPHTLCGHVSVFDCLIGTVRLRCEIEHETNAGPAADGRYRTVDDLLGPADRRYYGAGYKLRRHVIEDVAVGPSGRLQAATVTVDVPAAERACDAGLGADYQPSLSMIDCTAAMAQIAQVLLYHQDGVRRDRSNTLWMRRVVMESKSPYQPLANPFVVSALIDKTERVRFAGGEWRATRMVGDFQGIHAQASLAHQLPND